MRVYDQRTKTNARSQRTALKFQLFYHQKAFLSVLYMLYVLSTPVKSVLERGDLNRDFRSRNTWQFPNNTSIASVHV